MLPAAARYKSFTTHNALGESLQNGFFRTMGELKISSRKQQRLAEGLRFSGIRKDRLVAFRVSQEVSAQSSPWTKLPEASSSCKVTSLDAMSEGLLLRTLEPGDYGKGYLDLLAQLTVVGSVSEAAFQERVAEIAARAPDYHVAVLEDLEANRVVATGTLLMERKIIRNCGLVGHIEDVVVDSSKRGQHLGHRIISQLSQVAKEAGCYKVILDCGEANVGFYESCGFKRKEMQMALYF